MDQNIEKQNKKMFSGLVGTWLDPSSSQNIALLFFSFVVLCGLKHVKLYFH